jgi:hypothetical protein
MISLEEHISFFWNNLLATRDENIAETFRLFRGKMETEQKRNFAEWKWKPNYFGGSGNGNRTTFSRGTDAEAGFLFPTNAKFSFYSCFAWPI